MRRRLLLIALATVGAIVISSAALGSGEVTTLDDGGLYLFVSNNGTFAYDSSASRGEYSGLYYPRNTYRWVMSGGGIWVAGKVGNRWRVTISGAESEFAPGPVNNRNGAPSPFPIYKITRGENYALNDDYHNWPATLGAPTNVLGLPLTKGSQCAFTMFNDTDTARHQFDIAGTLPLGVEVRLYAYTYDNVYQTHDTMITQVVFLDYTVINRSGEDIDSLIVTLYGDPDIGYGATDRVGSDVESGMAFCYDESDRDQYYGSMTPAVGMLLLNELAGSTNFYYAYRRTDPASEKLDTTPKAINLVKGLRLTGESYVDAVTQIQSRFPYSGDVADSTGWLNSVSKDYRFVVNAAPRRLVAGDSLNIVGALIVARDSTRNGSVRQLVSIARRVRDLYEQNAGLLATSISPRGAVSVHGREMVGKDWGGRFLSGGLDLANHYFGDTTSPESTPRLRIRFVESGGQKAYRFVSDGDELRYASFVPVPIVVTDTATRMPLDWGFIDYDIDGSIASEQGGLDPLVVFTTDYDNSAKSEYEEVNLRSPSARNLIVFQSSTPMEDLVGGEVVVDVAAMEKPLVSHIAASPIVLAEPSAEGYTERTIQVVNNSGFVQEIELISSDPQSLRIVPSDLVLGTGESGYVFLQLHSARFVDTPGIDLISHRLRSERTRVPVIVGRAKGLVGDADGDGILSLSDLVMMIRILYRDAPILVPARFLDLGGDGDFDIADLVILLNMLYHQAPSPCGILN